MTKEKQGNWKNRIVESGVLAAGEFAANPLNWRRHPAAQADALTGALNEVGWVQEVIVNRTTGLMLDGHLRVALALKQGKDTPVPVKYVELSAAEERLVLATLDPIAAMAEADAAKLDSLMKDINTGEAGLQAMLAGLAADNGLYQDDGNAGADTEPQIDRAEELRQKWGVEPGQLWQLGDHRIICGDCTDPAIVARVMGGEKAALMATDPPYGVSYTVETGVGSKFGAIANDENDGPKLQSFLESVFGIAKTALSDNAAWYLWHAQMTQGFFAAAAVIIHRQIIWVKPSLILGHGDYHWRHELCFYGWQEGHRPPWYWDRKQTTVWEIGRENDGVHPTQKPVELFERPLRFNTKIGDIAYEPFSGSGSQIIACENLNRRCRAVEIDAGYVAVALERWAVHTGKTPVLIQHISTA